MDKEKTLSALQGGKLHLEGQFIYGSNYTFMVSCQYNALRLEAVYKPIRGERPLWDFPPHTLAKREVAAYLLSEALGWNLVPPTVLRKKDTPMGPGSLQLFVKHDPNQHYFNLKPLDRKRMPEVVLFDLLINNADRKAGHILIDQEGNLFLIDHGLSFHVEDKLRTVVWDYASEPISETHITDLEKILPLLSPGAELYQQLQAYLLPDEIQALQDRAQVLLVSKTYPLAPDDRRVYPWPLV